MNEIIKKLFFITIAFYYVFSLVGGVIIQSRLAVTRQQLESARMELESARNRQSELAEILRRDGEILSESSTTISGIRSQIAAIRKSYEEMENLLYNAGDNNSTDNGATDLQN